MKAIHLLRIMSVALIALLGACAFGEREANLQYPPPPSSDTSTVPAAQAAIPQTVASKRVIVLAKFEDDRDDKKVVGHVKNMYGMKTAEVVSPNDIPTWVAGALKWELEHRGHQVLQEEVALASSEILSGRVTRVYCSAYFNYNGVVTLHAQLVKGGEKLIDRTYTGKASGGINMAATGSAYARTLSLALQDGLRQLLQDIDRRRQ
jgi:hypothetical protein